MFLPTNITLKFGDSGDYVAELQRRLSLIKCFNADGINGFFDGPTVTGVSQFQTMSGIRADGVAGPETLRRLNGAISGDYGGDSPSDAAAKAAEEERRRQEEILLQQQQQQRLLEEQMRLEQQRLEQQRMAEQQRQLQSAAPLYQPPAPPEPSYAPAPSTYAPAQPSYGAQTQAYIPAGSQQTVPQSSTPSAAELLNQMMATAAKPQEVAPPQRPAHNPPPQQYTPPPAPPVHPQPTPAMQHVPSQQAPQAYAPPPPVDQQIPASQAYEPPAQTQTRGMVGRAMQYANEMVQKLANYFESKLPHHVINEVKQIGHAMANHGVKEVPIPQGPEQQRERGVEQQRGVQQGRQLS